ncbi:MAG: monovalent cation/H+ antiporter subunit D family protein [Rhodospirillales bacterium]
MISPHLPVLQVVVPLIAAPACVLVRHGTIAWALALVITWSTFAIALVLLVDVTGSGPISYAIGGWPPPWGIEYRVDALGAFVVVIVSAVGAAVMPFARASVAREVAADRVYLFYTMYLLCLAGLLGITVTGDAFNLFVFLEISSLSSYVLISLGRDRRAVTAAFRYLILGTIGATFYIIGVGMMYMVTGTLNIADLAERLPAMADSRTVQMALAFLTVGISLKLALFPLHLWLPNAYTFAPSAVTVFLAATATKVAVYVLMRIVYTVFGGTVIFAEMPIDEMLMGLGMLAMIGASLVAAFQDNVKRLLAYSSLSQIGYIVLGLSLANVSGLAGGIVHLFNHAMMKGTLFVAMGCVFYRVGSVHIDALAGVGRRMPFTMAGALVGGLSLIGAPLTVGFVSKWYLIRGALERGLWPVAMVVLVSGLLALIYFWRIVEAAYFRPAPASAAEIHEAPLGMLISLGVLAAACIGFGFDATPTMTIALQAAASLLGAQP